METHLKRKIQKCQEEIVKLQEKIEKAQLTEAELSTQLEEVHASMALRTIVRASITQNNPALPIQLIDQLSDEEKVIQ